MKNRIKKRNEPISYDVKEVKKVLKDNNLSFKDFQYWMKGQTCVAIEINGKMELGIYSCDLNAYLRWKLYGISPFWA